MVRHVLACLGVLVSLQAAVPVAQAGPVEWLPVRESAHIGCVLSNCAGPTGPYHGYWAIDLLSPDRTSGDPIYASGTGTAQVASTYNGCLGDSEEAIGDPRAAGNSVRVDHGGGVITRYLHLSSIAISDGQAVTPGTRIGNMGNTGASTCTAPHLHFEKQVNGTKVDPGALKACHGDTLVTYSNWNDGASRTRTVYSDGVACGGGPEPAPDGDEDGVPDATDACRAFQGPGSNGGCPVALTRGSRSLARGDFNGDGFLDLAVGSPGEDIGSVANAGAVFVNYGGPGGLPSVARQQLYSGAGLANTPEVGDALGMALAAGDFNGDGRDDLAVGVPGEDSGVADGGLVLTIHGSASGLNPATAGGGRQGGLFANADEVGDFLGASLAAGDFNADGYDDLAAGVPGENAGVADGGAVLTVNGSPTGLNAATQSGGRQGGFFSNSDEAGDLLGASLTTGDFNGDGYDDLAAGVPGENSAVPDGGLVLTVNGSAAGLNPATAGGGRQGGLFGNADEASDYLGASLAAGDFNADGYDDLAAGVPGESSGVADGGAVQTVNGSPAGLNAATQSGGRQGGFFSNSDEAGDLLGASLAIGDLNGDGYDDLLAGVPLEDSGVSDAGLVLTVNGSATGLNPATRGGGRQGGLFGNTDEAGDFLGASLAVGDFNGDCIADVAAGAPGEGSGIADSGVVLTVNGSASGPDPATQSGGRQGGFFGGVEEAADYLGGGFFPLMNLGSAPSGGPEGAAPGPGPSPGITGPAPTCGPETAANPPPPPPTAKLSAELEVSRARTRRGRLVVLAGLTRHATGQIRVTYRTKTARQAFNAAIRNGAIRINRRLKKRLRRTATGIVEMTYAGNERVRRDSVRLRAARGKALLRHRTSLIDSKGRLQISGTITRRARGVVRIRLEYAAGSKVVHLYFKTQISRGKWALTATLPVAARAGGHLSIKYTGHERRRIGGQQLAEALTP